MHRFQCGYLCRCPFTYSQFVEFEFYCMDGGVHHDVFSHCDDLQYTTSASWYFHRSGNTSVEGWKHLKHSQKTKWINPRPNVAFRGGTFKGLDITFGAAHQQFGGILIRSIQSLKPIHSLFGGGNGEMYSVNELIQGPCKCVDALLKDTGFDSVSSLTKSKRFGLDIFGNDSNVMFVDLAKNYNIKQLGPRRSLRKAFDDDGAFSAYFYSSPRVGLSLKKEKRGLNGEELEQFQRLKVEYLMAPYRSIRSSCASKIKKYKPCIALSMVFDGYFQNKMNGIQTQCRTEQEDALKLYSKTKLNGLIKQWKVGREDSKGTIEEVQKRFPTTNDGLAKLFGAWMEV